MDLIETLNVLKKHRTDEVVVATMGAEREWIKLSQHPRDFFYVPSAMGQAPTLGLGLALARPDLRVVVLNGDGCMLMNLGCLATIAEQSPPNYSLIVFRNGVYEVTGSQPVAGATQVDFGQVARSVGFSEVFHIDELDFWEEAVGEVLHDAGPVFAVLDVEPVRSGEIAPKAPCPMPEQIKRFMTALGQSRPSHHAPS